MEKPETEALARRLVETYSDQLLRVAYSLLDSVHDAQDVCQEVLLKRLSHPVEFESEAHERAWLIRVTVNSCKNLRRGLLRRRPVPLEAVAEQPAFQPEEGGLLEEIQRLSPSDRQVLVLYYYVGYDSNEIAALLSIRPAAVRARLSRARQKLKHRLEESSYEPIS